MDGREEHYENYRFYERLSGDKKITRNGNKLYKGGKVFFKKYDDYWLEFPATNDKRTQFTLEFKDGTTKEFINYGYHARLNDENKITRSKGRLYYQGMVFEQVVKDYWVEIDKGTKIKKSNRKTNSKNKTNGTAKFNKIYDSFYLTKDWSVWDFENMQLYFDRDDSEHMELTSCDKRIKTNGKSKRVRRCITYKGTKYYNVDNWRTWVAEIPKKPKKEILNHSNKIPITKFYKKGVWYFTPDKKTKNYRYFLKSNEIYVFSNKYAFWSAALWEKEGKVWYYRKDMLKGDKVKNFTIPIKEDEYYFKAEIKHLRKMGYKINYRYIKSKRQQPNKRNEEQQVEYMKKVKKMSRADRKKALNKKKKRQGKYRERRGL